MKEPLCLAMWQNTAGPSQNALIYSRTTLQYNKLHIIVHTSQVNSAFRARCLANSEVDIKY